MLFLNQRENLTEPAIKNATNLDRPTPDAALQIGRNSWLTPICIFRVAHLSRSAKATINMDCIWINRGSSFRFRNHRSLTNTKWQAQSRYAGP
jgi:hypothetical protein